jgi:uncharacterized protein
MSKARSSSPADTGATAIGRGPWPWLLGAGPALVVVASLASAWLAVSKVDPVISEDYYKLGLTINRRLPATPVKDAAPSAMIVIGSDGAVSVRIPESVAAPTYLRLTLRRPGAREGDVEMLDASAARNWSGKLHDVRAGLQIVTLESDAWRLPVTVVERLPATISLGGTDTKS